MAQQSAAAEAVPVTTPATGARDKWFRRTLFIPPLGFLVLMTIFPLLYSLGVSLFNYSLGGTAKFAGFSNYVTLFRDPSFWQVTFITIRIALFAVAIEMVLGVLLGFALHQKLPGMGLFLLIIFLPMMLAPLVVGLFWRFLLDQTFGLVDYLIASVGFKPIPWLTHPRYALLSVIIVDVWQWTPFVVLLTLAGLGTVPPDLEEAAELDRASVWMRFKHIYWPHLRFPLLLALTFRLIDTLKLFDTPFILTGGGPGNLTTTLSLLGYRFHFQFFQISTAAAISWVIVIIINIVANILVPQMQKAPRGSEEAVDTGL
ncbi:MAG: sugar ABC transporter permease [Deltaproteobacteria bacterium]|nr:MAG: sugar ABC transporter permease [Deltaproteobacteria bacterium]